MSLNHPHLSQWRPPPDYQPAASALDGVTVFAPRPVAAAKADAPAVFKCPNCGATTKFDVAAGGVACEHCGHQAPVAADKIGRSAVQFEFTLETLSQAEHGWGVARKELHCNSCGADLALAEGALTVTCPFCASNEVNIRTAAAEQLRPRFLIPFKVQAEAVAARAREWLGQGWFHPGQLASTAGMQRFTGVYLPFWTFDAHITADWRAEVGYEETERYYDHDDGEWKTRTVIRWRWENGRVHVPIDDLLITGSTRVSRLILERLYPFNLNDLVAYAPDFLAGWQAQAYDLTLPKAWEAGKAVMREHARQACHADIPTSHVRNFSMVADFADESWRYILLPIYIAAYRYEGKVYQVMANGQTGLVAGQKPVAWWKIYAAIALLLSPGACLGLAGLPLLAVGGVGVVPLVLGVILLVAGVVFSVKLHGQAVSSEAA